MFNQKLCIVDFVGTIFDGKNLFCDAAEFLSSLKSKNFEILILCNSSLYSKEFIIDKLKEANASFDNVITIRELILKELSPKQRFYVVGSKDFVQFLKNEGYNIFTSDDHEQISIEEVKLLDNINGVVIATDPEFNFFKAALGTRYVIERQTDFYCVGGDRRFFENNGFYPGSFTLSTSIKTPSFKDPKIVGKPNEESIKTVFDYSKYNEVWVIGDNLDTDIEFGSRIKAKTCLVLTGVTGNTHNSLSKGSECTPTITCKVLKESIQHII